MGSLGQLRPSLLFSPGAGACRGRDGQDARADFLLQRGPFSVGTSFLGALLSFPPPCQAIPMASFSVVFVRLREQLRCPPFGLSGGRFSFPWDRPHSSRERAVLGLPPSFSTTASGDAFFLLLSFCGSLSPSLHYSQAMPASVLFFSCHRSVFADVVAPSKAGTSNSPFFFSF